MAVDTAAYVGDFDTAKPAGSDPLAEVDNNLRKIKEAIKASFPGVTGPVTATHAELNFVDGVTSAIQTQLDAKAPSASPALTGTPTAPTASAATSTTQIATTAFVQTALAGATGGSGLLTLSVSNAAAVSLTAGQHDAGTYSSGAITWTLPASPTAGDMVAVTPCNGRIDNVVARNSSNIMSLAENMTINSANVTVTLRYINSTVGWRLI